MHIWTSMPLAIAIVTVYLEFFMACIFHGWAWNMDSRGWNFADEGYPKLFPFFAPCYKAMYEKCMLLI